MKSVICLAVLALVPLAAPSPARPPSAAVLADREEIRTLLLEYGRLLDDRKLRDYADLFARDGEWIGGFGTGKTPDGIFAMMTKAFATLPNDRASRNYHILTNMIVDVKGDRATAWSRWTFYMKGADNTPSVMVGGRYEDDLVREGGDWKFQRRVVISDIPYQDPRKAKPGG